MGNNASSEKARIEMEPDQKITKCPSCGSVKIKLVRRNWSGEFRGQSYTVENLEFYECPDCDERVYDREALRAIEANSPAFVSLHGLK